MKPLPPQTKKTYSPPVKKSAGGGSTESPDEFKKDITHKSDGTLKFRWTPNSKK